MLGDISPQTVRIAENAVVYPGRNHVTTLTIKRYNGRNYKPVDLDNLTRVVLVFPDTTPTIAFDSLTGSVFTWGGNVLTIDLSDYAMPNAVHPSHLIVFDAEHPQGQVLVDDLDSRIQFDFRLVSTTGALPPPTVEFITDAPQDGDTYGRKDGAWVSLQAVVSGVASVNGQVGIVVLDAADVGAATTAQGALADSAVQPGDLAAVATSGAYADLSGTPTLGTAASANTGDFDPAGAAAGAVSAHVAAIDPHPQYQTQAEGDARYERGLVAGTNITIDRTNPAAPVINAGGAVDSVNGHTGVVVLDAADVGADATGTAATAVAAHVAAIDPHPQYQTQAEGDAAYAPLGHVGAGDTAHANAVASGAAGFMTGADKAKLDGVVSGATVNSTDAVLLARANHTGTQPASTISDFDSASRAQTEAELVAGTNVTITPSGAGATRQLTISAAGGGGSTNLSTTTSATTLTVNSDTGTDAVLPAATGSVAGVLIAVDKAKLDGVAMGATANPDTDSLSEGATNKWFTVARALAAVLTGLSVATGGAVVDTDTVLQAIGKLQKQITDLATAVAAKMTNPMTTAGDIIVAGASGSPSRLAKGTDGQVLKMVAGAQAWVAEIGKNLIINGSFRVKQAAPAVTSGTVTLTAGQYGWLSTVKGFDRWKAGASGCTYTFSTTGGVTSIDITSGSLQQIVEGRNLTTGTHVMSWTGTAQGKIGAGSYSASGVTESVTGGTNLTVEFGTGTLSQVQLEIGSAPSTFEQRHYGLELMLCKRYFPMFLAVGTGIQYVATAYAGSGTQISVGYQFDVEPRVPPTGMLVSNPAHFNVNAPGGGAGASTDVVFSASSVKACRFLATAPASITVGSGAEFFAHGTDGAYLYFTGCEL